MSAQSIKNYFPEVSLRQKQTNNIIFITFWSQFAVYSLNTVLILFLTRPLLEHGLGYTQAKAYAFIGVAHAMGYLMPVLGGFMADNVLGVRRAILLGSIMVACAYLLVMISGFGVGHFGDGLFIAAYALVPATNSLLMGTASSMVSHIYSDDAVHAKSAMTFYYMAINVGALLATIVAPALLESRYGPLSILALTFLGKSLSALNFAKRYSIYDAIVWGKDTRPLPRRDMVHVLTYVVVIYCFTLFAYSHVYIASSIISLGCIIGIGWFVGKTVLLNGETRIKQWIAIILILEAVVFFIIYSQMNSTLVLFARTNSNHNFFGFSVSPAQYQMLNPLLILLIGSQLPRFYKLCPRFTIPYQFAAGTILAGLGLLVMDFATARAVDGVVEGNYIALTYVLISIAELWVSAVGLSMIGLYCDNKNIAFAMGVWYLASSLAHALSGRIAGWVAIPSTVHSTVESLGYYKDYYGTMGLCALVIGVLMYLFSYFLHYACRRAQVKLV